MKDILKHYARIEEINRASEFLNSRGVNPSQFSKCYIIPGLTDVHVHLREPGFLYKETMKTGTMAAAAGGFTDIFAMPNLDPCPDNPEHLQEELDCISKDAIVNVYPYGAITVAEKGRVLSDMRGMEKNVIAYSDDGVGVASAAMMRTAMIEARRLGKIIVAHCEDENYPRDSHETEWKELERDLKLADETGCAYHACHISTRESIGLIRAAKASGIDVTCETAPHYLTLARTDITDSGKYKMNPPIKDEGDREALIGAVCDGTIDMIATDHAPHSREEKAGGFEKSAYGIVGLETAFPVLYTRLVDGGVISLDKLIELLYVNPRGRFSLEVLPIDAMLMRQEPTFTIMDLEGEYVIDPDDFFSKGRSTPFEGWKVKGRCMATVINGEIIYLREGGVKS